MSWPYSSTPNSPLKTYIGDGVYADVQNGELILTTEDGISTTNRIVFGPDEWESLLLYARRIQSTERSGNAGSADASLWGIRHVDGRWRTLEAGGIPTWTDNPKEALVFRLRKHADAFSSEDPEDVRIVPWVPE